ncbi:hypothetical protein [Marinobacter sp.]|uniref:hypothetical protein n=1 Tax=Marinobacter sp. TaxID=50741 RepID=UPI002630575B|nr:hypothetical protein [Marinobacter sp.]
MTTQKNANQMDIETIFYSGFMAGCEETFAAMNGNSSATRYDWCWEDFSEVVATLVDCVVNHPNAFDTASRSDWNSSLPVMCANVEQAVNERAMFFWGYPSSREMMFERVRVFKRPIMIAAREIAPLALRCMASGEQPDLKSQFGLAEFLYPRVLSAVKKRAAQNGGLDAKAPDEPITQRAAN